MLRFNFFKKNLIYFLTYIFIFVILPFSLFADTYNVSVSARVNSSTPPSGGGGGGGGSINLPTVVNFSGMAYPMSKVYILKDGKIAVSTIADPGANFSVSLSGLSTDTYTFSVYGEDSNGKKSSFFSFPIYITSGTTVNIGNIFLSPTIDIDKTEVKKGDNLIIFGQSAPTSEVTISVHSDFEHFFKVFSNSMGGYLYNLDTSILEFGSHETKSKSAILNQISPYTNTLSFKVGMENKLNDKNVLCSSIRADLNCDGHVNLVDFSIMAYWYKKVNPPLNVDLSNDGKITLVDFSIMAFHWTG